VARVFAGGTTDTTSTADLDRLHATRDEVDYLRGEARKSCPIRACAVRR